MLIDTNIFLHAVNKSSPACKSARQFLDQLLRTRSPWCTTWPVMYEFLRVSTHPKVFAKPLKPAEALAFIDDLTSQDEVTLLTATDRHVAVLHEVVAGLTHPGGNLFHDIHTATLMKEHGIREIVTADTDFLQFRFLEVINPVAKG